MRPRVLSLFAVPNLVCLVGNLTFGSGMLINVFNAALLGLSAGVVVAYHRPVVDLLMGDEPMEGSDWLALGIFLSWLGSLDLRGGSMIWRMLGRPDSWENNSSISYGRFLYGCAGVFHLPAKGAMGRKQIPTERWVRIGALISACIFGSVMVGYALDALGIVTAPR